MLLFGSAASLGQVIALADLSTGLMTIVNVTALFLLSKVVVSVTKDYHQQHIGLLVGFHWHQHKNTVLGHQCKYFQPKFESYIFLNFKYSYIHLLLSRVNIGVSIVDVSAAVLEMEL